MVSQVYVPKCIKLYTLSLWSLLYIYHTSIRLFITNNKKMLLKILLFLLEERIQGWFWEKSFPLDEFFFYLTNNMHSHLSAFLPYLSYIASYFLSFMVVIDVPLFSHWQTFIDDVLCAKYCCRFWGYISEHNTGKCWWSWCSWRRLTLIHPKRNY